MRLKISQKKHFETYVLDKVYPKKDFDNFELHFGKPPETPGKCCFEGGGGAKKV